MNCSCGAKLKDYAQFVDAFYLHNPLYNDDPDLKHWWLCPRCDKGEIANLTSLESEEPDVPDGGTAWLYPKLLRN